MLNEDKSFKLRYHRWKKWSAQNQNKNYIYRLLVLFGLVKSSFDMMYLPRYKSR